MLPEGTNHHVPRIGNVEITRPPVSNVVEFSGVIPVPSFHHAFSDHFLPLAGVHCGNDPHQNLPSLGCRFEIFSFISYEKKMELFL